MAKGLKKITRSIDIKSGDVVFSNDKLSYGVGADKQVKLCDYGICAGKHILKHECKNIEDNMVNEAERLLLFLVHMTWGYPLNRRVNSYVLKHRLEKFMSGGYCSNGAAILAALRLGLSVYIDPDRLGPNVTINLNGSKITDYWDKMSRLSTIDMY